MSKRAKRRCGPLLTVFVWISAMPLLGQSLFIEDFSNPASAASRFTFSGNVTITNGVMTAATGGDAWLNLSNQIADNGNAAVRYSVIQSFAPGDIQHPNSAESSFAIRASGDNASLSFYTLVVLRNTLGADIGLLRTASGRTTALLGGSSFAPPALATFGPYQLDVLIENRDDSVLLTASVNGVTAITYQDTSPSRITQGTSMGLYCGGTRAASWDNLRVDIVIPEPGTCGLFLLGLVSWVLNFRRSQR